MRRALGALLAALLLMVSVPPAPGDATSDVVVDYVTSTVSATNTQRVLHGLDKLRRSPCLAKRAVEQARRMARRGRLFHQDLRHVQRTCHMGWVGENVAYGYPDAVGLVNAWMASPGHRANILKRQYRQIGIGAVEKDGVWWVAQVFGGR